VTSQLNPSSQNADDSIHRLELLLFYMGGKRRFGINVLKVKEVIPCPPLNHLPSANHNILGVSTMRGLTVPIINLAQAVRSSRVPFTEEQILKGSVITTEINRSSQGLWVTAIDKIKIVDWKDIKPPSQKGSIASYTTGITLIDGELVQILDIEKVLGEVLGIEIEHDSFSYESDTLAPLKDKLVFVVDDSPMAVKQTTIALDKLGLKHIVAVDGKLALEKLINYEESEQPIDMIISDIEMPEMDGYTFVKEVRKLPEYKDIHILMHTSLNGQMNLQRAISAGANDVLTKFVPEELAKKIVDQLTNHNSN